jgi:hypothetical protein
MMEQFNYETIQKVVGRRNTGRLRSNKGCKEE